MLQKNFGKPTVNTTNNHVTFTNLAPRTPAEHYWASRAQKAEALLSARERHYEEIGKIREEEAELQLLENRYKEKYSNLERLVFILVVAVLFLIGLIVYLISYSRETMQSLWLSYVNTASLTSLIRWRIAGTLGLSQREDSNGRSNNRINFHFHLPSHFTIPILSPWTSVTEQQTSHTTRGTTSTSFLLVIFLLAILIASIIYLRVSRHLKQSVEKGRADDRAIGPVPSSFWQLLRIFNCLPSLGFWAWARSWGYQILGLLGLAPR
ncbi:hypothetical protein AN958_09977 [Leucoagaricus sp. SymC.cos]|nr:hypothetical protein AN958_09977 [Leucoagaricus sp. SymC.cos]